MMKKIKMFNKNQLKIVNDIIDYSLKSGIEGVEFNWYLNYSAQAIIHKHDDIQGSYFKEKMIIIDIPINNYSFDSLIITLVHEIGHYFEYMSNDKKMNKKNEKITKKDNGSNLSKHELKTIYKMEKDAWLYGKEVLKILKLSHRFKKVFSYEMRTSLKTYK